MIRKKIKLACFFLAFVLSGCSTNGLYQLTAITGGVQRLNPGTVIGSLLLIFGGETTLEQGAYLDGSVYMLDGTLALNGKVSKDVTILGGDLILGPGSQVGGDINLGGGQMDRSPDALIIGQINTGTGIRLPDLPNRRRTAPLGVLLRLLLNAGVLALLGYLLARRFPRQLDRVSDAALKHSLVSGSLGILVGIVGLSLLVLMAFTILLIPVSLLGLLAFGLLIIYGWIAVGHGLGQFLRLRLRWEIRPDVGTGVGTFLFMMCVNTISQIPTMGGVLAIVVALVGLGAVFLTRLGIHRFIPRVDDEDALSVA